MLRQHSRPSHTRRALIGLLILISLLPGCGFMGTPEPADLWIKIDSPASGMEVRVEDSIAIQSTATSPTAVSWIELWVDGELVDTAQAPTPLLPQFSAVQRWQASALGEHLIEVRAYDENGTASPPDRIVLRIGGKEAQIEPTLTPDGPRIIPTVTPMPSVPLPTSTPAPLLCDSDSDFVEDLTIPDNTEIVGGNQFEKTWRVRNTGTCPWGDGYELAFVESEQMGGPDSIPIPPCEPEAEIDISATLVAPEKPGKYRGDWKLRGPDGELFGAKLYVQIVALEPTATPELTSTLGLTVTPAAAITATRALTGTATPTTTG
jgi:hypothetical protein